MKRINDSVQKRLHWRSSGKSKKGDKPTDDKPDETPKATELLSELITYRVRCLPPESTFASAKSLLETALDVSEDGSIFICSLAYSVGYGGTKTAIIRAKDTLLKSPGPQNRWSVKMPADNNSVENVGMRSQEILFDTHFEGLTPFNSFDDPRQHQINVVAITGLAGHAFRSFKERSSNFMWLMDALPLDLEGAQIWTYGYDTKLVDSTSFQDLEALASTFRRSLMSLSAPPDHKVIPLIFIGHSLGGLILKEALVQMSKDPNVQAVSNYQATYGLLLFGCPNQGMDVSSLIPMCEGQVNLPFLFDLGRSSERLRQLCRDFPKAFAFPDSRIISFYETKLSPTAVEESPGVWKMNGPLAVLVDPSSATHSRPEEDQAHDIHGINRTHSELVKFGRQDLDYTVVLGFLQEFKLAAPGVVEMRTTRRMNPAAKSNASTPEERLKQIEICKWLAPVNNDQGCDHFMEDLDDARSLRHPDTCQWIEPRVEYQKWSDCEAGSKDSLLWIHAIPGAGKTVLASYVMDNPVKSKSSSSTVLYFFFKNGDSDKNTAISALRSLIYQLLQNGDIRHTKALYEDLQECKERAAHSRAVSLKQLWNVFARNCACRGESIIILDALDECGDVKKLLPDVLRLPSTAKVKVAFTSRREPELNEALQNIPSLAMGPEDVKDDIKVYLEYRVTKSRSLSDPRVRSRITRILNSQNKGMFLWVRLMADELESCVTVNQVEETLSSLPEGLPEVYERILRRLQASLKRGRRDLCVRLLKWLVLVKRPLHLREMNEALRLEYAWMDDGPSFAQNSLCTERDIESICGSLVTVKKQIIELIHLSAKEFLMASTEASILRDGLENFLVDVEKDSASVACSCANSIKSKEAAKTIPAADINGQAFKQSCPFIEYACFHWISHVTDSTGSATVDRNKGFREFILSRKSLSWVEKCFTFRRHAKNELRFEIQKLLDWALGDAEISLSSSALDLLQLFSAWCQTFLRLLNDYGPLVEFQPCLVYQIDPRRFCQSVENGLLESFCRDSGIQRHDIVRTLQNLDDDSHILEYRKLQQHPIDDDSFALFNVDKDRNAIFTVDNTPGTTPLLHCQEIKTGRKLMPVIDNEFVHNTRPLYVRGAAMSPKGEYLAIRYNWTETRQTMVIYTVVWALDLNLKFGLRRHPCWAQKVFSSIHVSKTYENSSMIDSRRPIAFDANGYLHTVRGQIKIETGEETPLPEVLRKCSGNLTFSSNGKTAILHDLGTDLNYLNQTGNTEVIPDSSTLLREQFHDISHTGRFIVWDSSPDADAFERSCAEITVKIFNTDTKRTISFVVSSDTESPLIRTKSRLLFAEDESSLFGFIMKRDVAMNDYIALYVWKIHVDEFTFWNSKSLRGLILGHHLDTEKQHLYIIDPGRLWNRVDLNSRDLCDLDEGLKTPPVQYSPLSHRVSYNGNKVATLGVTQTYSQASIEVFEIDTGNRTLDIVQSIPENSDGPYLFSPDLKYLFIQSFIIIVQSSDLRIVGERISPDVAENSQRPLPNWDLQYAFSSDSSHFAHFWNYKSIGKVQFGVWSLTPDRKFFKPFRLPDELDPNSSFCILQDCDEAGFGFHPQGNAMLLSLWRKAEFLTNSETKYYSFSCFILDLTTAKLTKLEPISRKSAKIFGQMERPIGNDGIVARFSADGSYAVLDPERWPLQRRHGHDFAIFYVIPSHLRSLLSIPPLTSDKVFNPRWHDCGLSFSFSRAICSDDRSVIAICLKVSKGSSSEKLNLTYLPAYLTEASFTIIGEKAQVNGQERLKILFCLPDGGIEVKYINRTLLEVLEESKLWKKYGKQWKRGRLPKLEQMDDTDSKVEDLDRNKWEPKMI